MLEVQRRLATLREATSNGRPLYERVAHELAQAIRSGELEPGERLPSVRQMATDLGLSVTTVMSVYTVLSNSGLVNGETGRGTFVSETPRHDEATPPPRPVEPAPPRTGNAWRRILLAQTEARLKDSFPAARDLTRGGPDPWLLPLTIIKDAYQEVSSRLGPHDLEYPSTLSTEPELADVLVHHLAADGIDADADDMLIACSTQQLLAQLAMLLRQRLPDEPALVGVEEPGYQTAMDTLEFHGLGLVPMPMDDSGVTVPALRAALQAGVSAVLLTPRAQSPTSCSWTAARRQAYADALAEYPKVLIMEDDHLAESSISRPGSLYADQRLRDRVVYMRSFAKSIAPDMRLALAVARPPIRHPLTVAKSFADGWTSRISQRVLARTLADPRADDFLSRAGAEYARRRTALRDAILRAGESCRLDLRIPEAGPDGLHVWVTLPPGCDAGRVVEMVAGHGFLLTSGEPFFVALGNQRHIRINAGSVADDAVPKISAAVTDAVTSALGRPTALLTP
jgi:GntR family transcriptional regulator/MocR family aminotransferase